MDDNLAVAAARRLLACEEALHLSGSEAALHLLQCLSLNANDAVMVTAAEPFTYPGPRIVYVNPAFSAMSGFSAEEAIGQTPRMLQGPLSGGEAPALIRAALNAWKPIVIELLNYRKNGTTFWVELSISPLADEKGWFTHWISVQRDITARKRQENTLRRSEAFLARAGLVAGVGSWELEMETGMMTWSAETSRIHGLTPRELPNLEAAIDFYAEEARPAVRAAIATCIEDGKPFKLELPFIRADGKRIWVRTVGEAVFEDGTLSRLAGAFQDITAEVTERAARARSEAEFRASFEVSLFGKLLADPTTRRIIRANDAFAEMLGYESGELVGHTMPEFIWHEDRLADAEHYRRLLANEISSDLREKRYVRRDGTPFWALTGATIAWPTGSAEPSIAVISAQDIDAQINQAADLLIGKAELEHVLGERTSALAQRDLLLQEVYHRVKNNLQVVDTLLTMQSRGLDDPQSKLAFLELRGRIRAISLVHEQLMESPDLQTFDIVPFLEQLSRNIVGGVGNGGVSMEVKTCNLKIGLDFAVPLGLLVTELVTNSFKHAMFPAGEGLIRVQLQEEPGDSLYLSVSDNGQGHNAGQGGGAKAGMGTSIIRSLVAQLEGVMDVKTNSGTMTEIRMPMPVRP
jgi:PAS domain S-box-containing protein